MPSAALLQLDPGSIGSKTGRLQEMSLTSCQMLGPMLTSSRAAKSLCEVLFSPGPSGTLMRSDGQHLILSLRLALGMILST